MTKSVTGAVLRRRAHEHHWLEENDDLLRMRFPWQFRASTEEPHANASYLAGYPAVTLLIASALIGINREARGHAAGLRTTVFVGLAAAVAMIHANLLLPTNGKTPDLFSVLDLMRLPLGILTGVGFIGGGAILKKGSMVVGITTAATLWVVTTICLCFGGGQLGLGITATALTLVGLSALKCIDVRIPREQHGTLVIEADAGSVPDLDPVLAPFGCRSHFAKQQRTEDGELLTFSVRWHQAETRRPSIGFVAAVARSYTVESFAMRSESAD